MNQVVLNRSAMASSCLGASFSARYCGGAAKGLKPSQVPVSASLRLGMAVESGLGRSGIPLPSSSC